MRSVALAGLVATLGVPVGLAQRVPPPFTSYSYRLHDPVTGGLAPMTDGPRNTHRLLDMARANAVGLDAPLYR